MDLLCSGGVAFATDFDFAISEIVTHSSLEVYIYYFIPY